jgi:uncharacterized protein YoxC
MNAINFKEGSRKNWAPFGSQILSDDQIKIGCLQRIADAVEAMSENYSQLIKERDFWQKSAESRYKQIQSLQRRNAALRGHLKRAKKG